MWFGVVWGGLGCFHGHFDWLKEETHILSLKRVGGLLMNIHEFRHTLIRVSNAIQTQRTYTALETHIKREFAGQIRGR